jgi:hypothetical protein
MPAFARVIPWLVLGFALMGLWLGFHEWAHPPFSDEQLKASLADTWEVATSTTRVFGIVFLGLGGVCVALARKYTGTMRVVAYVAAVACVGTLLVFMRNHVVLAERVGKVTGSEIGAVFGLF